MPKEFKSLDLDAVIKDLHALMTDSQDWWPADYGHYGPFFIRMAWHSAGTYRISDGRGGASTGTQRFAPLNSWPDNVSLDKARRLLWPIKQKYGRKISWADLMVLTGNVALESMGFKTFGFAGGRVDVWEPEEDIYWGPEAEWLGDKRYSGDRNLENPLGAVQMGLIYVNPEGPNGKPDPVASARDIRETFARMAMDDEETVALVAGGHTFGKCHGAADPSKYVGPEPEGADIAEQGLGWKSSFGSGSGVHTISSGLEGAWTTNPIQWDNDYLDILFKYEWELTRSPAGAQQWTPKDAAAQGTVPDAHDPSKRHAPMMSTADLALRMDPAYEKIARRYHQNPEQFADAFARAWYKLTHRDMGPVSRYLGPLVPKEELLWQDPVPALDHPTDRRAGHRRTQGADPRLRAVGGPAGDDGLGIGVHLPRQRHARWRQRRAHSPGTAEGLGGEPARGTGQGAREAGGDPAVVQQRAGQRQEARLAGRPDRAGRLRSGRGSGAQGGSRHHSAVLARTHRRVAGSRPMSEAFAPLEPAADGFRNYVRKGLEGSAAELLVDKANLLTLTAPEMTVLVGGMRALGVNAGDSCHGVFTQRPGALSNDFFVNLLDMRTRWQRVGRIGRRARRPGPQQWPAQVDRHRRRPGVRFQLAAARAGRGLCQQRCAGAFREGIRGGVEQGHGPGPLRPEVMPVRSL